MSEKLLSERLPSPKTTAFILAGCVAVGGAVWGGKKGIEALRHDSTSLIVAGVPAQVESYDRKLVPLRAGKVTIMRYNYWLGLEQCSRDGASVQQGTGQTQSFDPAIGQMSPACYWDWVKVSAATYYQSTRGQVIVFDGTPIAHLGK